MFEAESNINLPIIGIPRNEKLQVSSLSVGNGIHSRVQTPP